MRRQRKWKRRRKCLPVKWDGAVWKWWEAERISKPYKGERLQQSPRSKSKQAMTSKLREHTKTRNTNEASGQRRSRDSFQSFCAYCWKELGDNHSLFLEGKLSKQKSDTGHTGTKRHITSKNHLNHQAESAAGWVNICNIWLGFLCGAAETSLTCYLLWEVILLWESV